MWGLPTQATAIQRTTRGKGPAASCALGVVVRAIAAVQDNNREGEPAPSLSGPISPLAITTPRETGPLCVRAFEHRTMAPKAPPDEDLDSIEDPFDDLGTGAGADLDDAECDEVGEQQALVCCLLRPLGQQPTRGAGSPAAARRGGHGCV